MNKNIAENLTQGASNLANKLFDKVDVTSEAGRDIANQSAKKTQRLLDKGIDKVNNFQQFTGERYTQCTTSLSRCITEKPVQSALVIAGIGALLALCLTKSNKRGRRY